MAKNFMDGLHLDSANLKIVCENRPKTGGFSQFRKSFVGQLWNNVKANWLMLVFCLPLIAWVVYCNYQLSASYGTLPFSGNIGIGYPVVNDVHIVAKEIALEMIIKKSVVALPLIIIASVGLAGLFNVSKYLVWGFQIKIIKTFFRGVKNSFAPCIWVGMMLGICYILFNLIQFGMADSEVWAKVLVYIALGILAFCVLLLSLFITTQSAVFNLSLMEILKNSFKLATRFILQNSLIVIAGLLSMSLPLLTFIHYWITLGFNMVFFMLAFSYLASVWTVYTQYLYDMIGETHAKAEQKAKQGRASHQKKNKKR